MDILDKLIASSSDLHTVVPQNINIYFDTLRTPEENEEYQRQLAEAAKKESMEAAKKHLEKLIENNKVVDEQTNAVLNPDSKGVPFVDLIF
jgi:hypothetical protein